VSQDQKIEYLKTLPEPTSLTKPFWDYCKSHELRMQYCLKCSEWIWYPKAWCPACGRSENIEWRKLSGNGSIYSFTVIRQVIDNSQAFQNDIPFVIALVELEEGPRIYSNLRLKNPLEVRIGDRVKLFFDDVTSQFSLPKFEGY
jgi:uncharacterized OB-fold protein